MNLVWKGFWTAIFGICLVKVAYAEWQPIEEVRSYAVSGRSGAQLYESIGQRGPMTGQTRAIAHTTFKLTWTRKYEPRGNTCVLSVQKPKLIITYTLPKAEDPLPASVRSSWQSFIEGIRTHEKSHGQSIIRMVRAIETQTLGLTEQDDPTCRKLRVTLQARLKALSDRQREEGRAFDQAEMSEGGNVQQLVLKLVNGP
ncbi:DUF922 domain-containing Zn-dependent protease [Oryzifoliimicrobium ureilyticus]|uniref:DUF922 domain-containing Zn-dependent protease n=1 Tax=Oryzifoliimicrobium ureilyticus TaxID=3113724 RepID=UPI00307635B2